MPFKEPIEMNSTKKLMRYNKKQKVSGESRDLKFKSAISNAIGVTSIILLYISNAIGVTAIRINNVNGIAELELNFVAD